MAGEYAALVLAAQNDTDPEHRQRAMDAVARAAERLGMDTDEADAIAAPALSALYGGDGDAAVSR